MGKPNRFKYRRYLGQISILIIFSLIPLFTLFAFVVNIGMLVNAKISLQNAADLAAYAGAATQARQLTQISHLNYAMRQAYKKFIYKFYVIGNLSLRCFPRGGTAHSTCPQIPPNVSFDWINPPEPGLHCDAAPPFPTVPAVCVALTTDSNACQLGCPVPKVQAPSGSSLDPMMGALSNVTASIRKIQTASCGAQTLIAQLILHYWLYATDLDSSLDTRPELEGLVRDVGLVIDELVNKSRIDTLQSYVNEPPKASVRRTDMAALQAGLDEAKAERTILAFKTAYFNLNENVFDQDSIEMTELLPDTKMLVLNDIKVSMDVPYVIMDGSDVKACKSFLDFVHAEPIVGVYKTQKPEVFYAVKLTAKARIFFNPFPFGHPENEIDLTVYAAAKPFGSRIGPEITQADAQRMFTKPGTPPIFGGNTKPIQYPFLRMSELVTMDQMQVLQAFHSFLTGDQVGAGGAAGHIDPPSFERAKQASLFPDEAEIGQYNIPVDNEASLGPSRGIKPFYFLKTGTTGSAPNPEYTFWAPIMPLDSPPMAFQEKIKSELGNIAQSTTGTTDPGPAGTKLTATRVLAQFTEQVDHYVNSTLRNKQNFNVARIVDPFGKFMFGNSISVNIPGKVTDSNDARRRLATSFTTDHDKDYYTAGREGYSVKLIPIKSILNTPGIPQNVQADLQKIAH